MVTHDFAEALALGERTAILNNGRIEQVGPLSQVFQQPATPFVAEFVGMKNIFSAEFKGQKAIINSLELQLTKSPEQHTRAIGIRAEDIFLMTERGDKQRKNIFEGDAESGNTDIVATSSYVKINSFIHIQLAASTILLYLFIAISFGEGK